MRFYPRQDLVPGTALTAGMRVGLLGGSFDPPHPGHVHISRQAMKRFGLDKLIWLVSPGNPLKPNPPAPFERRRAAAQRLIRHPDILLSDFESRSGTRYTAQTLAHIDYLWPDVRFVWLMGADNLAQFHHWENWHEIMRRFPIGVLARPGKRTAARTSPASRIYRSAHLSGRASQLLPDMQAPAWCFVNVPMNHQSSTAIRAAGDWTKKV